MLEALVGLHVILLVVLSLAILVLLGGGGFLAGVPVEFIRNACKYEPKPDVKHGQAMCWHEGKGRVHGVTELTECVRIEDAWSSLIGAASSPNIGSGGMSG